MSVYFTLILAFFLLLAMQTGRVVITLYALRLGADPLTIGALAAVFSVLPTLLSWHIGRFTDRFGSRLLLTLGCTAGALGMIVPYITPGLVPLFIASTMYGLVSAFSAAPLQNLMGLLSGPQDSAKNFSNLSLVVSFSGFAGPLLAGFSFDHAGPSAACLALILLSLIPAAMLAGWGGILPSGTRTTQPRGSVRSLLAESGLWRLLATSSLVVTGTDLFQIYLPVYGQGIGLSASLIGILLGLYAFAAFVVRFFLSPLARRFSLEGVLACSFLIGAAGFLLLPLFKGMILLSLVAFLFGIGTGCAQPITMMMIFSNSTEGRSGETLGLRVTVNNLVRVVCQVLFGSIGSVFGVLTVFWINAVMFASGWFFSHPQALDNQEFRP